MRTHNLAQINIARLLAPIDDPRIADFVAQLPAINALAESSPGFVWRLKSDADNALDVAFDDDPLVIVNMSVWESVEALRGFAYRSQHVSVFRDRSRWFEKMPLASTCMWWIRVGELPTVADAKAKLEAFRRSGSTPDAFSFAEPYPAPHPAT
jgi:hypothetical protein